MTVRIEDDIAEALSAMIEDTKKDRSYLINFALRMLCEAGGPDGLFMQKTKAVMMESLGFDNTEALLDIIDARVAVLAGMEPGSLGQVGGPFLLVGAVAQQPIAIVDEAVNETRRDVPRQGDPVNSALHLIHDALEAGKEPLLDDVAAQVGMDKNTLAVVLSERGVKTSRVRRDGARARYFLKDQLFMVRGALGIK